MKRKYCRLNSPSKIEGVPNGRGRMIKTKKLLSQLHHTPPSLRATSPNLRGEVKSTNKNKKSLG